MTKFPFPVFTLHQLHIHTGLLHNQTAIPAQTETRSCNDKQLQRQFNAWGQRIHKMLCLS